MIGRTIGIYRVVEQVGMGGMATVYKAYDPQTDRYVALKILPQQYAQDATFISRFEREARAIARLEHIHILPIFAYGEDDCITYMAMRYMDSGTLADYLAKERLDLPEIVRLIKQVADALDYAHSHDVIHRDVKPGNILLDNQHNAFLTDFGIAKIVAGTLNLTGDSILGTPAYMSPEQCRGITDLPPASDQYALGIILYEMVTGRTPHQAETPLAVIQKQLFNEPFTPPRQIRPDLSPAVEAVMLKALAREPEQRYPTCNALATALEQAVTESASSAISMKESTRQSRREVPVTKSTEERRTVVGIQDRASVTDAYEGQTVAFTQASASTPVNAPPRRIAPALVIIPVMIVLAGILAVLWQSGILAPAVTPTAALILEQTTDPTVEPTITTQPTVIEEIAATAAITAPANLTPAGIVASNRLVLPGPEVNIRTVNPCGSDSNMFCITEPTQPRRDIAGDIPAGISTAAWSPDGRFIVFSAPSQENSTLSRLYIVDVDTSMVYPLTQFSNDVNPVWSPNGEWIAFHSSCSLALFNPATGTQQFLYEQNGRACILNTAWSADSQQIAAIVAISNPETPSQPIEREVWLFPIAGGEVRTLASMPYDETCRDISLAFSYIGDQIAYYDADCQPVLIDLGNPAIPQSLSRFPDWWKANAFPQWGHASSVTVALPQTISNGMLRLDAAGYGRIAYSDMLDLRQELTIEAYIRIVEYQCTDDRYKSFIPLITQAHVGSSLGNFALTFSPPQIMFGYEPIDSHYLAPAAVPINQWTHVALTHRYGAQPETTVYINGGPVPAGQWYDDLLNPISPDPFPPANSRQVYTIGRYGAAEAGCNFIGFVDEMRIWRVLRTAEQIRLTQNVNLDPETAASPDLAAYWTFDHPQNNQTVADQSAYDHTIQLSGSAVVVVSDAPVAAP